MALDLNERKIDDINEEREFATIPSSYGPDSREVKAIAKLGAKRAAEITIYEFMQGMVDYGRGHTPSPRIFVEYQNSEKTIFDGNLKQSENNPIIAIEFVNGGQGMGPEDTVINRHGGDDSTLGTYGKGTTLTLCYLAQLGIETMVSSHYNGQIWKGRVSLKKTESGITKVLNIKGIWNPNGQNEKITSFRIENPTAELCKALSKAGEIFLYANPAYPDAIIIPVDKEASGKAQKPVAVDMGEVMHLKGIVSEQKNYDYIYIDGLKLPIPYGEKTLFPWAVKGLSEPKNYKFKARRSHDSTFVDGYGLSLPVIAGLQCLEDKNLLEKFIKKALKNNDEEKYLEFTDISNHRISMPIPSTTAKLVKQIWETKYDNALIEHSRNDLISYERFTKNPKKVTLIPVFLYRFLALAGIKTLKQETGPNTPQIVEIESNKIYVPSAYESDSLEQLIKQIAKNEGEVDLESIKGKNYLKIKLPSAIKRTEEFNGQTDKPIGMLLRIAAVIAHMAKIDYSAFSLEKDTLYKIEINPQEEYPHPSFKTEIKILAYQRENYPEYETYETNSTYVLMAGDTINTLENQTRLETLIELFLKIIEEIQEKIWKTKKIKRKKQQKTKNAESAKKIEEKAEIHTVSWKGVGQIPMQKPINRDSDNVDEEKDGEKSKAPSGYYQDGVGTAFIFDPNKKAAGWQNIEKWEYIEIKRKTPDKYSTKIVDDNISGQKNLLVKTGEKIAAYRCDSKADLEFFREIRTGIYCVKGSAKKLVYYTQPDNDSEFDINAPIPTEKENLIREDLLMSSWKNFIDSINQNTGLTVWAKIKLIQEKWNEAFQYNKDNALSDQEEGNSREEIATRILNTSQGICNLSASGFAFLLRAIEIPSRVCCGYWKQGESHGGRHMWVEYWNNKRWTPIETEIGIQNIPDPIKNDGYDIDTNYDENKKTEIDVQDIPIKKHKISKIKKTIYMLIALTLIGAGGLYLNKKHTEKQIQETVEKIRKECEKKMNLNIKKPSINFLQEVK